jgi:hypothetical protein
MTSPCAFVIRISMPLLTLREIIDFLLNRSVSLKSMNLHCISDMEGILLIHCGMENDKIRHTGQLLEKMKGVMGVDVLQARVSNLIKDP